MESRVRGNRKWFGIRFEPCCLNTSCFRSRVYMGGSEESADCNQQLVTGSGVKVRRLHTNFDKPGWLAIGWQVEMSDSVVCPKFVGTQFCLPNH